MGGGGGGGKTIDKCTLWFRIIPTPIKAFFFFFSGFFFFGGGGGGGGGLNRKDKCTLWFRIILSGIEVGGTAELSWFEMTTFSEGEGEGGESLVWQ